MNATPPIPPNFGIRYVLWYTWLGLGVSLKFIWRNAITVLSSVSAVFTAITVDPNQTLVSHETFHYILLGQLVLTIVLAQIKRSTNQEKTQ